MTEAEHIRDTLLGYVAGLAGRNVYDEVVTGKRQEYSFAFYFGYEQGKQAANISCKPS